MLKPFVPSPPVTACLLLMALAAPLFVSGQSSNAIQVQIHGGYSYGLDDTPPKHTIVGAAGRLYFNSRVSFEPEFSYAKGFGEFNQWSPRGFLFIPNIAIDLNDHPTHRPYLIGGASVIRYVRTYPSPEHFFNPAAPAMRDEAQHALSFGFGGGVRMFLTPNFFVSPEVRIGLAPIARATVGLGYVVRNDGAPQGIPAPRSNGRSDPSAPPRTVRVEIAPGIGYTLGSGSEQPAPNLWSPHIDAAVWFNRRFGFAFSSVRGVGQDLYENPLVIPEEPVGDTYPREYRGSDRLRYHRLTFRYRRPIASQTDIHIGTGLAVGGRFRDIVVMHTPEGPVDVSPESRFGGLASEIYLSRRILPHLSVRSGAAFDFNLETNVFLPMVQIVFDF